MAGDGSACYRGGIGDGERTPIPTVVNGAAVWQGWATSGLAPRRAANPKGLPGTWWRLHTGILHKSPKFFAHLRALDVGMTTRTDVDNEV